MIILGNSLDQGSYWRRTEGIESAGIGVWSWMLRSLALGEDNEESEGEERRRNGMEFMPRRLVDL